MSKKSRAQKKRQQQKNGIKERENQKDVEKTIQDEKVEVKDKTSEVKSETSETEVFTCEVKEIEPVKEEVTCDKVEKTTVPDRNKDDVYETLPNERTSTFSKVLSSLLIFSIILVGVLIFITGSLLITQISKDKSKDIYVYNDTVESAISSGNMNYFNYFISNKDDKTYITSPFAIQKSLYDFNCLGSTEDFNIFKAFNNGYNSWGSSSDLLSSDYVHTISIGNNKDLDAEGLSNEDLAMELRRRIKNITDSYIDGIDLIDYTNNCKIVSILGLDIQLLNSWYNKETNLVYYKGDLEFSSGEDYTCLKLDMKNDYKLYLLKSNDCIIDLSTIQSNFSKKQGVVALNPYIYQSRGETSNIIFDTSLCNSLEQHPEYSSIVSVLKFGINCQDLEVKKDTEKDCNIDFYDEFLNDYSFIIETDKGQFILLGYVNE